MTLPKYEPKAEQRARGGPLTCQACGESLWPGAALRVTNRTTGEWFVICRTSVSASCIAAAGQAGEWQLSEYDHAAVLEYDRIARGDRYDSHDRETRYIRETKRRTREIADLNWHP